MLRFDSTHRWVKFHWTGFTAEVNAGSSAHVKLYRNAITKHLKLHMSTAQGSNPCTHLWSPLTARWDPDPWLRVVTTRQRCQLRNWPPRLLANPPLIQYQIQMTVHSDIPNYQQNLNWLVTVCLRPLITLLISTCMELPWLQSHARPANTHTSHT